MAGRNALTQPRRMETMAPPVEDPISTRGRNPTLDPENFIMSIAREAGYMGNSIGEAAAIAEQALPTDSTYMALDHLKYRGVTPGQQDIDIQSQGRTDVVRGRYERNRRRVENS